MYINNFDDTPGLLGFFSEPFEEVLPSKKFNFLLKKFSLLSFYCFADSRIFIWESWHMEWAVIPSSANHLLSGTFQWPVSLLFLSAVTSCFNSFANKHVYLKKGLKTKVKVFFFCFVLPFLDSLAPDREQLKIELQQVNQQINQQTQLHNMEVCKSLQLKKQTTAISLKSDILWTFLERFVRG